MADREKVIKGLEHCTRDRCKDCPYDPDCEMCSAFSILANDALELLKEYEDLEKRYDNIIDNSDAMLTLLKERNAQITVLQWFIENMSKPTELLDAFKENYTKIVQCKDCKYGEPCNEYVYCRKEIGTIETSIHKPDWFCADGERK